MCRLVAPPLTLVPQSKLDNLDLGEDVRDDFGKMVYRAMVVGYFVLLPSYFWYRWLYTIEWDVPYRMYYQTTICVAEMFGAICVMMLAVIRFPEPWAYNQLPPEVPQLPPSCVERHILARATVRDDCLGRCRQRGQD